MDRSGVSVMVQAKSMGLAVALALFFGGLGLLYATITGGIIMLILQLCAFVIAIFTLGFGGILFIPIHIISVIWAMVAVKKYNEKLITKAYGGV